MVFLLNASNFSWAAPPKDHWYKVETPKKEKAKKTPRSHQQDSIEIQNIEAPVQKTILWNLEQKLLFGGGLLADRGTFEKNYWDRFFIMTGLRFRQRPTYRLSALAQLLQSNTFFLNANVDFTPSRKAKRTYYGFGVAHQLISEKEFANFVDRSNFFVTGHYGYEFLTSSRRGYSVEFKTFLGSENYAFQISIGFILPI